MLAAPKCVCLGIFDRASRKHVDNAKYEVQFEKRLAMMCLVICSLSYQVVGAFVKVFAA